jgi:hypothetical protein
LRPEQAALMLILAEPHLVEPLHVINLLAVRGGLIEDVCGDNESEATQQGMLPLLCC